MVTLFKSDFFSKHTYRAEVKNLKDLKNKMNAFKTLYGDFPNISFYASSSDYHHVRHEEGEIYNGYCYNDLIKSYELIEIKIGNKYVEISGKKLLIKPGRTVYIYFFQKQDS